MCLRIDMCLTICACVCVCVCVCMVYGCVQCGRVRGQCVHRAVFVCIVRRSPLRFIRMHINLELGVLTYALLAQNEVMCAC